MTKPYILSNGRWSDGKGHPTGYDDATAADLLDPRRRLFEQGYGFMLHKPIVVAVKAALLRIQREAIDAGTK